MRCHEVDLHDSFYCTRSLPVKRYHLQPLYWGGEAYSWRVAHALPLLPHAGFWGLWTGQGLGLGWWGWSPIRAKCGCGRHGICGKWSSSASVLGRLLDLVVCGRLLSQDQYIWFLLLHQCSTNSTSCQESPALWCQHLAGLMLANLLMLQSKSVLVITVQKWLFCLMQSVHCEGVCRICLWWVTSDFADLFLH